MSKPKQERIPLCVGILASIPILRLSNRHFPQLRDERRQLDYNYDYLENVQAITFPKYPILYKDKDSSQLALTEMEWGVLPTYIDDPKLRADRRRNMINVRSERILEDKKSYWYRLRKQRCLIPVVRVLHSHLHIRLLQQLFSVIS
ncbi:SOS response-associated peptidase family protein [Sphingobacterium athyrii]|uniref:SOS response-associated peptidase family protein n=1 Tax=Sphingobacterium athyrii TaxID=2152717 RepID=UPI0015E856F9|nr:SOS response-associated peptidase family protein [Sphingobacterium athyrii]